MMAPASVQHQYLEGNAYMDCSQQTAAIVDSEIQKLLQQCYEDAKRLLTENRQLLDEIAEHLLVKETITGEEMMAFVNAKNEPAPELTEENASPEVTEENPSPEEK